MTYQQAAQQGTQAQAWLDASSGSEPKISLTILKEVLEDVKRALAHDRRAAQAGIARISAILSGSESGSAAPAFARGGFAPWQKRRIETYMTEHLEQSIKLNTLAKIISLSTTHFGRAFKQTFGKSPHAYLTSLRVQRAKEM